MSSISTEVSLNSFTYRYLQCTIRVYWLHPCGYIRARTSGGTAKRECFKERVIYIRGPSVLEGDFMCLSGNGRYEAINFKNPDYPSAGLPLYCKM